MKKLCLALCMMLSVVSINSLHASTVKVDSLYYELRTDAPKANVVKCPATNLYLNYTSLRIPDSIEYRGVKYAVTGISENAFAKCTNLTSVELPKTLVYIDFRAFYGCTGLTELIIPDRVVTIMQRAFQHCEGLQIVKIGKNVQFIDANSFADCYSLQEFRYPRGLDITEIRDAFREHTRLIPY